MAYVKVMLKGDAATELTGTAYSSLIVDSSGDVVEVAHGTVSKVWTSGGASADPTWEDAAGGAHALDAGQSDVTITTPADDEVLSYESGSWINKTATEAGLKAAADAPTAHDLAGTEHNADTLADLNAKVSDATLDDSSDTRVPSTSSVGNAEIDNSANDIAFSQIILTSKIDGSGTVEGTFYFDSDDKHPYVYVGA